MAKGLTEYQIDFLQVVAKFLNQCQFNSKKGMHPNKINTIRKKCEMFMQIWFYCCNFCSSARTLRLPIISMTGLFNLLRGKMDGHYH